MNHQKRIRNLQKLTQKKKTDNVLITSQKDVFYYTGFETSGDSFLLISKNSKPILLASPLDNEAELIKNVNVVFYKNEKEFLHFFKKFKKLGYDESNLRTDLFLKLKKMVAMKPCAGIIKKPRMIKDGEEIEKMNKAIKITGKVLKSLEIYGKSEEQVAREITSFFSKNYASNAFDPIVATEKNGYFIHHVPKKTRIERGLVIIDIGARFENYCSDVTRVFSLKTKKEENKVKSDVLEIQHALIDEIRDGVLFKDVQNLFEKLMKKHGYKVWHAFGHGVGLSPHEHIGPVLKKNMVLTVEPGVYIKNFGGCRIEDMVLVKRGKGKVLSGFIQP